MPNLKDMKKAELIILVNSQSEEIKDLGKRLLGTLDPVKVTELVAEKDTRIDDLIEQVEALHKSLDKVGKSTPKVKEKCVSMFFPNVVVYDIQTPPSCFGYPPTLTEANDFRVEVPESRVEVELTRKGQRLLTAEEYEKHLEEKAAVQAVLDSDELEDDLE